MAPGLIRGIDPRDNVYVSAHRGREHFRGPRAQAALPKVTISLSPEGFRLQTSFTPLRKRTARDFGLAPILMLEK